VNADPVTSLPERLLGLYPALAGFDRAERDTTIGREARHVQVPAGAVLFEEGTPCSGLPFVLTGSVRVARSAASGRSLELYRVTAGELCVVSLCSLFGEAPMVAEGRATEDTELLLLSPTGFARWAAHEPFRRFVFGQFANRLADVMAITEAVAFQRVDQRLAGALLGHGSPVRVTHQALAEELGTAREIVSRLLKRFEHEGWVRLSRECVDILDSAALRQLAAGASGSLPAARRPLPPV
jgi:CRP/FNR family transcriptional regulator